MNKRCNLFLWPGFLLGILVIVTVSGCVRYTTIRQHPDFANHSRTVESIFVLPPDVEVVNLVFKGDHRRLPEREKSIKKFLTLAIPSILEMRGYEVSECRLETIDLQKIDMAFQLHQLKAAHGYASAQLYEKRVSVEDSSKVKVTVGPIVNPFADLADADVLLMLRYSGFEKSKGLITKQIISAVIIGVLTGVVATPATSGGCIDAMLIDGTTGDILWCNAFCGQETPEFILNALFRELPNRRIESLESDKEPTHQKP